MIDKDGFRPNVGIILCDQRGRLFWARRVGQQAWQFPQGGIDKQETPIEAMYRELYEEVGLLKEHVRILGQSRGWLRYRLPRHLIRDNKPRCIGQKQKWFMLQLVGSEDNVCFDRHSKPEFDEWRWVTYWYPLRHVVSFKREVYRRALLELAPKVFANVRANPNPPPPTASSNKRNKKWPKDRDSKDER